MSYAYNDPLHHVIGNALNDGCKNWGVVSGLAVSERAAGANMSVDVALGVCFVDGVEYTESGITNVVITAADGTNPRKDLIVYDTSGGTPAVVTGTPAATAIPPDIPSGDILLAVVDVPALDTTITNDQIYDGRVFVIHVPFVRDSNVIREVAGYDNDFVIGSPQLADDGNSNHDARMFFDKSKGAFRAGKVTGTQWDDANVGDYSHAEGYNTTASGDRSHAEGYYTTASVIYSHAEGGVTTASGVASHAEGYYTTASGDRSHAEGYYTTASGNYSHAEGYRSKAYLYGQHAKADGRFSSDGDAQLSNLVARIETTDATANVEMFLDGIDDRAILPANRTWAFTINIAARQTGGTAGTVGDSGIYKIEGGIKRDDAGNTALVGAITKTVIAEDQAAWDVTAEADDTNDALVVKVTGEANKTIHWVAKIDLVEVG